MSMKLVTLQNLTTFANEVKAKYAKQSALEALATKVDGLVTAGGEPNILEGVKVNGVALEIAEKMVDILVATGSENGTISVNNANIAVAGLQALAFKAQISEADLDEALKTVLDAKASGEDLTNLTGRVKNTEDAIDVLNGDVTKDGSVAKQVSDAVAAIVADAPEAYDTLVEISTWISEHSDSAASMNAQIVTNKNDIATLTALVGNLPEGATSTDVVSYIAEAIAGIGIGDYAKTAEVNAAIAAALEAYYTSAQVDNLLENYVLTDDIEAITDDEITALLSE